jgi:hypothetical protein
MGCTFLEGSAADILCSRRRENDAVFIEDTAQFLKDIPCGLARGPGSDVWALPTPGGPDDFARLVQGIASGDPSQGSCSLPRLAFVLNGCGYNTQRL